MFVSAVLADPMVLAGALPAGTAGGGGVLDLVRNTANDLKQLIVILAGVGGAGFAVVVALRARLAIAAVLTVLVVAALFVWGVSHLGDLSNMVDQDVQQRRQGLGTGHGAGAGVVSAVGRGRPGHVLAGAAVGT